MSWGKYSLNNSLRFFNDSESIPIQKLRIHLDKWTKQTAYPFEIYTFVSCEKSHPDVNVAKFIQFMYILYISAQM